jgi:hypothetical protein
MQEDVLAGDYRKEDDEYIKMRDANIRREKFLKIGIGSIYILLLVVSLFIV